MFDVQVIEDPEAAAVALEPTRSRLLSELATPASAATLAARVGLARQKVNYHLKALEAHGLVTQTHERKWGGLTERLLVASATSYVVSPSALGAAAADPNKRMDKLSASYLIALGARIVREVASSYVSRTTPASASPPSRSIPKSVSVPRPTAPPSAPN
jgi:DNA-binding transcriptional ArsR family regulator